MLRTSSESVFLLISTFQFFFSNIVCSNYISPDVFMRLALSTFVLKNGINRYRAEGGEIS